MINAVVIPNANDILLSLLLLSPPLSASSAYLNRRPEGTGDRASKAFAEAQAIWVGPKYNGKAYDCYLVVLEHTKRNVSSSSA